MLSLPEVVVRASPHQEEVEGRVPAGPRAGVRVLRLPQLSATGRRRGGAGPGSTVRTKRAGGRRADRTPAGRGGARRGGAGGGTLTQQQDVLPRGELGSRAGGDLAEDAGPNGEQGAR